jgi:LmbE family N-acetylglucosaminyl deacetylase
VTGVHYREATATDRDAILALRARCFGDVDPEKADPRFWEWEFGRGRMFVGESDGVAATHLAMLDLPHMLDGRIVRGALAVDAMTAPQARGQGAFGGIVRYAATHSGHLVATAYQIRKAVLGAMLRGGWAEGERVPVLVRPAFSWRRAAEMPALGRDDTAWMSELAPRDGCIARTPEFLAWRFFDNPHWRYRVTGIRGAAYLVTRRTTLKGIDTLAIVDVAFRERRAARMLLREAIAQARRERCTLVAALLSRKHPAFWMFVRAGFVPGPHWFRLLVHPPEHAARPWRVTWADTSVMHVVFVFAHQDDEVAFASRIRQCVARGDRVTCVCLTDGAGNKPGGPAPGVRDAESRRVLAALGVHDFVVAPTGERIPDGALPEYLDRALEFLDSALDDVGEVVTLAWEGGHQDHDAAHLVAAVFARERGVRCVEMPLYTLLPGRLGVRHALFRVNQPVGDGWSERRLTRREYLSNVLLVRHYASQRKTWLGLAPLLLIGRPRELTRDADLRRAAAPPHPLPLLYELRFRYPHARFDAFAKSFLRRRSALD